VELLLQWLSTRTREHGFTEFTLQLTIRIGRKTTNLKLLTGFPTTILKKIWMLLLSKSDGHLKRLLRKVKRKTSTSQLILLEVQEILELKTEWLYLDMLSTRT
jgi:hypothetical protein